MRWWLYFTTTDSPKNIRKFLICLCLIPIIKASEKNFLKLIKLVPLYLWQLKISINLKILATEQSLLKLQKRKSILIFYQIKCLCLLKHTTLLHSVGPIKNIQKKYDYRKSLTITFIEQ